MLNTHVILYCIGMCIYIYILFMTYVKCNSLLAYFTWHVNIEHCQTVIYNINTILVRLR